MGKYMRKCRGAVGEVAAMEVTQVVGVRTRSRSASAAAAAAEVAAAGGITKVAAQRRKAPSPAAKTPPVEDSGEGFGRDGGSCYLQLRSRMLFMAAAPAPAQRAPRVETANSGAGAASALAAAGISHCSSTASSADVVAQERSPGCRLEAAEAGVDHSPECSVCNSESGRERRETTPSSQLHGEVSDLESDLAGRKHCRRVTAPPVSTTVSAGGRARVPPAAEIEEFFAAAEEAEAKRFAAKYNFDVVHGVPLDAGRFEWSSVVSN